MALRNIPVGGAVVALANAVHLKGEMQMRTKSRAIAASLMALSLGAFVAPSSHAGILFDNGAASGASNPARCDSKCGGSAPQFIIYDDFALSSASNVAGFTYNSYDYEGSLATDYTGTIWSIWNENPALGGTPVFSGTTVGVVSSGVDGSLLVTVTGLDIDLAPGTYWLGTSNNEDDPSGDITIYALASNGFSDAEQSTTADAFSATGLPDAAFTIEGSASATAPEPTSFTLFGSAIIGLGAVRRCKRNAA